MTAWSLTFAVHSTLWLGLAWLLSRLAPRMHPRTRETIWYTAIGASLIGPSVLALGPGAVDSLWRLALCG